MTHADCAVTAQGRSRADQGATGPPCPVPAFPHDYQGRRAPAPPPFTSAMTFDGRASRVASVRRWLEAELDGHPAAGCAVLAASELAANAVRHTSSGFRPGGTFAVYAAATSRRVTLLVTDQGGPREPCARPAGDAEAGRGLMIVQAIAESVQWFGGRHGRGVLVVIPPS